jgi:hypothetical protein
LLLHWKMFSCSFWSSSALKKPPNR